LEKIVEGDINFCLQSSDVDGIADAGLDNVGMTPPCLLRVQELHKAIMRLSWFRVD
jgi:hypothetical protein